MLRSYFISLFLFPALLLPLSLSAGKPASAPVLSPNPLITPRQRPEALVAPLPVTRWAHIARSESWTRGAMMALHRHGQPLVEMVPRDISDWCPAYETAEAPARAAFWVGFLSALAKHESTYKPRAVGGGGLWFGLMQILPATARGYGCVARSGEALKDGAANLSCAIRIMAVTVPRDGVIAARDRKWRGVAADWGPMQSAAKRRDIAGWTKIQDYCIAPAAPSAKIRPKARVETREQALN